MDNPGGVEGMLENNVSNSDGVDVVKRKYVSEEQVRKAEAAFTEMAKKPKFLTFQQAIEKMYPKILEAMEQGYSYQDVLEVLKNLDIQVSLVTLRQYLGAKGRVKESSTNDGSPQPVLAPIATATETIEPDDVDAVIEAIAVSSDVETIQTRQQTATTPETLSPQTAPPTAVPAPRTSTVRTAIAALPVERVARLPSSTT